MEAISLGFLPEALLEIIVLLAFLNIPGLHEDQAADYQVIEFFAGAARIARMGRALNLSTTALDRDVHSSMDINTAAGFVLLVNQYKQDFTYK